MQTLEEVKNKKDNKVDKMPNTMTLSTATKIDDINSVLNALPKYKDNKIEAFAKGAYYGMKNLQSVVPSLQLYGETAELAIGGYFGASKEYTNRKVLNIATLQRNLLNSQRELSKNTNPETMNSWSFGLGQGAANLLTMYATGGFASGAAKILGVNAIKSATVAGLGANVLMENVEQQSERMPLDKNGNIDINKITPEWAKNSTIGTTSYLAISTILEDKIGFGKQITWWETPVKAIKNKTLKGASAIMKQAGKTALSEGLTEGLQSLASTGILFKEGVIDASQLPERISGAWKEAIIGGILGGTVGTAVSINQQHNVKTMLSEEISKVISDPTEVENIVDTIYDSGTAELTNVISTELELSSELSAKHGAIYDNMSAAISDAIKSSGAFNNVDENEIAEYTSETARMFADQVLAEANKRGALIDDVLKASDIKFEDGMIRLKSGDEVVAENQVAEKEVTAKIVTAEDMATDDNLKSFIKSFDEQKKAEKEFKKQLKERDRVGIAILLAAANRKGGKVYTAADVKGIISRIRNGNTKRAKYDEAFLDLVNQPDDSIVTNSSLLSDEFVRDFYSGFDENVEDFEHTQEELVRRVLDDLTLPEKRVMQREDLGFDENVGKEYNKIVFKMSNAKSIEKLTEAYESLETNDVLKDNMAILEDLTNIFAKNLERLENENTISNIQRNGSGQSELNARTEERTSEVGGSENLYGNNESETQQGIDKLYQSASEAGANSNELEEAKKEWLEKGTDSKYFKKWFANSVVVDEDGNPLVVYHGSTDTFSIFDRNKASKEGNMGAGFYFTSSEWDADDNYHGGGPDFENKVSRRAEQIQQEYEDNGRFLDYSEYEELARKEMMGVPAQYDVYLKITNPCYVGNKETYLFEDIDINEEDYETEEEYWQARDEAIEEKLYDIVNEVENSIGDYVSFDNVEKVKSIIYEIAYDGGITLEKLKERLSEEYIDDINNGDIVSSEVARTIVEALGYDGIVDSSVSEKFKGMNIASDTTHYIVFNPEQIKSVSNQGTFDETNPDIYYQVKGLPKQEKVHRGYYDVNAQAIKLLKDADYSTLPHELAHYWLDNMWTYVRSGKASEQYLTNFEAVKDFLRLNDNQIFLTRQQQERFAGAYERYLYSGYAPVGLGGAFKDYDRWLQKVYNSANNLKVALTPQIIDFFDSMTTANLTSYSNVVEEMPKENAEQATTEENTQVDTNTQTEQENGVETQPVASEQVTETKQVETTPAEEETPAQNIEKETVQAVQEVSNEFTGDVDYNTLPVQTDGKEKTSSLANMINNEDLEYSEINIKEQVEKANTFVRNNLEKARNIVNGKEQPPKDLLKNAVFKAYLNYMKEIGNTDEFLDAMRTFSLTSTRMGQEISVLRDTVEDIYSEEYWINRIENIKKNTIAKSKFKNEDDVENIKLMNKDISEQVDDVIDEFLEADATQQNKIANDIANKIAKDYGVGPDKLFQSMKTPKEIRTKSEAYKFIYKAVNNKLGFQLTKEQAEQVIAKVNNMQKSMEQTISRNGNPSVLFFKNLAEMENYANSLAPTPALMVLTSIIGRGNMLASSKSIALNIESNIVNYINEAVIKRITNKISSGVVDKQAINDYLKYSTEVYKASGYQVSSMPTLSSAQQILSEKMIKSQGETGNIIGDAIRGLGRFYEQTVFKYGMGGPDLLFKDRAFVSTADLLATKAAKGNSKVATEIFKDAILVEPKTEIGRSIREQAINDALAATYQQNTNFTKSILQIRNGINKATGDFRLGDLISPFVKTPINVINLGVDYSIGGLKALPHLKTIVSDFEKGRLTDTTKKAIRSAARNGLGLIVAAIISSFIDDKDYIPERDLCTPKERELVKLKGGNFNSVKIGDKYYNLDYFGPVGSALVGMLMAKKKDNVKDKITGYLLGSTMQMSNLPVAKDFKEMVDNLKKLQADTAKYGADAIVEKGVSAILDFANSRLIPAIVSDIAKISDGYERETYNKAGNRLKAKIPVLRQELPLKYNYGTGAAIPTEDAAAQLLAGARVKSEINNSTIREIERISKTEKISLKQVTKSIPDFKAFSDERKSRVEKIFAQNYAEQVSNLIETNDYQNMDDTERAKEINKIRKNLVEDIKIEYGLKEPKKSKKKKKKG